ncbi:MAG: hypothetical protein MJ014_03010 [Methanocorpusculum sp.]|nr:hypothetical protein [Methanocorpusculum sp.]
MRVWMLVCIVLCITATPVSAGFLITEICPDGYAKGDGDEYFVLPGARSLDGWVVTDGEGSVRFPSGSASLGNIVIAREGTAYHTIHDTDPDNIQHAPFHIRRTLHRPVSDGRLPGTILLLARGLQPRNGRIHICTDGIWDERIYNIGQNRFSPETFTAESVTLFVSPDSSFEVVDSVIDSTRFSLCISMYEFTPRNSQNRLPTSRHAVSQ